MVTQIQLGNIFSAGDKQVVAGGNTGIDVEGLIESLTTAKRQPAVLLETRIEQNALRSTALTEMQSLLEDFKDAANFLRNPPGVQNDAENVFQYRNADISSNTSVAGSNYLSVTAEPGTNVGDYDIEIIQLATRNIQTTNTFALATADTAAVGVGNIIEAGTLFVGASLVGVDLEVGDTLTQVASKINAVSGQSGIEATVVKISNGNFRLSFKATETGTDQNYNILTINPGKFNVGFAIQQNAMDSQMELDGTIITRQTNAVDDVVDGLTFNLIQATPGGTTLEVNIEPDAELVKQGIINFVESYNAFRLFTSRQSELGTNGQPTDTAILANNSTMRQTVSRVNAEITSVVNGITSGDPSRLSDIGITFSDYPGDAETPFTRNIFTIDEEKLDSALQANFEGVRKVFEFDYTSSDPDLQIFSRANTLAVSEVQLNIDITNGVYEATYNQGSGPVTVQLDFSNISGGGVLLTGRENTALEGLSLIYSDTVDTVIDLSITQGIGDRVFNTLDEILSDDNGLIDVAVGNVETQTERYQAEITRIDESIDRFREQLLTKFANLEAAINSANQLLASLEAQSAAQNSSS